jgi:hypothetical protein
VLKLTHCLLFPLILKECLNQCDQYILASTT